MRPSKKQRTSVNQYSGFTVPSTPSPNVDTINAFPKDKPADEWFFNNYIKLRKPAKILCDCPITISDFGVKKLSDKLHYEENLKVEKKHNEGFGSGMEREEMKLDRLLQIFSKGDDSYYLTTQYDYDEGEEAVDDNAGDNHVNGEDDEEDDEGENENEDDEEAGFGEAFSETSSIGSIDMNDLHDDFEENDSDSDDATDYSEDPLIDEKSGIRRSEAQYRIKELLQPPLTNLYKDEKFPIVPSFFNSLIPQQINLWMGNGKSSTTDPVDKLDLKNLTLESIGKIIPGHGASSGLHHDHADNLYILVEGLKRFTLYSPADALKLMTVGEIYKVFANGLIDYKSSSDWRHLRNDGALLRNIAEWKLEHDDFSTLSKDELMNIVEEDEAQKSIKDSSDNGIRKDPQSFSQIPPLLLHLDELKSPQHLEALKTFAETHFPGFLDLDKLTVWLKPGEQLYLPAGWFHEVTSFSQNTALSSLQELATVHIAINYWFVPPTEPNFQHPYQDDYWKQDFEATEASIEYFKSSEKSD